MKNYITEMYIQYSEVIEGKYEKYFLKKCALILIRLKCKRKWKLY